MGKKFRVYAILSASQYVGEFTAETEEEAIKLAEQDGDYGGSLCHQCAGEFDLGDAHDFVADECAIEASGPAPSPHTEE